MLPSASKVLDYFHCHHSSSFTPLIMEIEYFEEEGVGSGPTLEFFSEVQQQQQQWLIITAAAGVG